MIGFFETVRDEAKGAAEQGAGYLDDAQDAQAWVDNGLEDARRAQEEAEELLEMQERLEREVAQAEERARQARQQLEAIRGRDPRQALPSMPAVPSIPSVPSRPTVPAMPELPGLPEAPELPSFDRPSLNGFPGLAEETEADGATFEDQSFEDSPPEREETELLQAPEFAKYDDDATAVLRVCRNSWNTIDTRAIAGHWFSA